MIQRIQSFWLVLAACCMALCFMTPMAEYHMDMPATGQQAEAQMNLIAKDSPDMLNQIAGGEPLVTFSQRGSGFHTWPLVVLAIAVGALALVCIFLFRNRVLQMRLVAVAFLLTVVYVFLIFFWAVDSYAKTMAQTLGGGDTEVTWFAGSYAAIVSLVFLLLAHRAIKKDEAKVRAADRLR